VALVSSLVLWTSLFFPLFPIGYCIVCPLFKIYVVILKNKNYIRQAKGLSGFDIDRMTMYTLDLL
jgi:hypothetical protein